MPDDLTKVDRSRWKLSNLQTTVLAAAHMGCVTRYAEDCHVGGVRWSNLHYSLNGMDVTVQIKALRRRGLLEGVVFQGLT